CRGLPKKTFRFLFFIKEADHVNLYFILLDRFDYFSFFDRAVLLQPVADDDKCFSPLLALLVSVIGGGNDCVKQRCTTTGEKLAHCILQLTPVTGELLDEF